MIIKCEFCESKFTNKSALNYHMKTAKYCLKLRGETSRFTCDVCEKELSDKRQFEKHIEKCLQSKNLKSLEKLNIEKDITITLLKEQIKNYEKTISDLQNKLENVAVQGVKKSTTTNIMNIENLTDEWLRESSKNLTIEHIQKGPQGYAEFASQHSLKNRVKCVDFARQILQYKEDDELIRDKKGKKLSKKFFESIETNKRCIRAEMDQRNLIAL